MFQSTPPEWGATDVVAFEELKLSFQSTPPEWGATCVIAGTKNNQRSFNPRPPSGERPKTGVVMSGPFLFQSTPPEWGATSVRFVKWTQCICFNPRPPSGERLRDADLKYSKDGFQSTPPEWGATQLCHVLPTFLDVSIHAPRVGSDKTFTIAFNIQVSFNPRPPSGERLPGFQLIPTGLLFQSTPPEWGATKRKKASGELDRVSIHAPRVGSDLFCKDMWPILGGFNPRPPSGERPHWL